MIHAFMCGRPQTWGSELSGNDLKEDEREGREVGEGRKEGGVGG